MRMDYSVSENSGTDDDLPPFHQNRNLRSRVSGTERSAVDSVSFSRMYTDMEAQIHYLEQEAYCAVLRAFKAQSDAITWDKESLITELRKELRVSDDEHRELLTRVNSDDIISKIREWRKTGGHPAARFTASQPVYDLLPSPTLSRKKQKTSKSHGQPSHGLSTMKSMQYRSTGPSLSRQLTGRSSSGALGGNEPADLGVPESLVGRKVWTRWPEDNSFYQAIITLYSPTEGRHKLHYDIDTPNETWEWVNLKEMSPEDISWGDEDPGLSHGGGHVGGPGGRRVKKSFNHSGRRGRGLVTAQSKKQILSTQNGLVGNVSDDLELLNTDTLVKEVERVFNEINPDPFELEKARRMLKDHEQALVDAIARLAYASDGESDGGERTLQHGESMDV